MAWLNATCRSLLAGLALITLAAATGVHGQSKDAVNMGPLQGLPANAASIIECAV
jgi:hypothetical protein